MDDGATNFSRVPKGTDLVEWYFEQGWTDGLPVVPPTGERVATCIAALGELARAHTEPDLAAMVLDSLGLTIADLKAAGADHHDLALLKADD